jgi:cell division protease FtsH
LEKKHREQETTLREALAARNREWVERWDAAMREKGAAVEAARKEAQAVVEEAWQRKVGEMLVEKETVDAEELQELLISRDVTVASYL